MGVQGRSRFWACPPAVAVLVAAILIGVRAESAQSLSTCTDVQLVPNVSQLLVSQGAPGYTRFARGKETIVRAYLTTPTTCSLSNKQSIAPISATLNVANGDSPAPAQLSNYAPLGGKLGATQQIYSTSDPFFVVPASYFAPTSTTNTFNISFTLNITYTRNGLAATYTANSAATTTKAVDQQTHAIRVLVVPMGDPTSSTTQWSALAESTLENVMTNAGRAYPVPTGVSSALCDPTSPTCPLGATGGIRYVVSPTLLDLKSLGLARTSNTTTKFCISGANWANTNQVPSGAYAGHTLKADLLQRLADYNLYNNPPADLVLGVVDGAISWKSTDGLGCDDGRAATPDPVARTVGQIDWVRVSTDAAYPTPLQMELMHPFGISHTPSFHSANVEADGAPGTATDGKGYNVLQRKVIDTASGALGTNDHSIMNYNTTTILYTPNNTLLEPTDWSDALCNLGGVDSSAVGLNPAYASCTQSTAVGTSQGVGGNHSFYQVSGILPSGGGVRVTQAKANVNGDVEMGVSCNALPSVTPPLCATNDSSVHLLLCAGGCTSSSILKDVGLALLPDEGHDGGGTVDTNSPNGFDALVATDTTMTGAALRVNNGPIMPLGDASEAGPTIQSTSAGTPGTLVRSFPMTVDNGNGRAIAFDGTYLYATLASGSTVYKLTTSGSPVSSVSVGTTIGALAYNAATGHLYGGDYTGSNGNVYDINPGDGAKSTVFSFDDTGPCLFPGAGKSIDGLEFRPAAGNFAVSGDACDTVYIKNPDGSEVSHFGTTHNSGITTDGAGGLWLALLTRGDAAYTELTHVDSAGTVLGDPIVLSDYAAEDLAYDSVTFAPTCVVWMNQATFTLTAKPEIRAVAVPCGVASSGSSATVQTTNTKFVSLFFTCGDPTNLTDDKPTFPLANGLRPDASGDVIAAYTNKLFCGEGTPQIISEASNGWKSTGVTGQNAAVPVSATSQSPVANIASPLSGVKFRRGEFIHYEGSASDAEQEAIVAGLNWYFDGTLISASTGKTSFDQKIGATAPIGNHTIKLEATDSQGHVGSTTVMISIGPALCPSTSNCP
jgi:hypothetical protein